MDISDTMLSPIKQFYANKSVLITGATGFVGKVVVEKLLRTCDEVDKIYILIRHKKGKTVEDRWKEYLSDRIFTLNPDSIDLANIGEKIIPITGDLCKPNISLSAEDLETLIENVSIVLHVAGDVHFDEPLRLSIGHNLKGTKSMLELCHKLKKIEALVYVSTMTVVCPANDGREIIHKGIISPEHVIETCETNDDKLIKRYQKLFFPKHPNVYTISKSLAEQLLDRDKGHINVAIVRPSAVQPSYREPVPGWVDVMHGPVAVAILSALGLLRVAEFDFASRPGLMPVDMVSSATIAAAWHVATNKPDHTEVYHLTTETHDSPSLLEIVKMMSYDVYNAPSKKTLRPMARFKIGQDKLRFAFHNFFSHWVFAYFVDLISYLTGYKSKMVDLTKRMQANITLVSFFVFQYDFKVENTRCLIEKLTPHDRREFDFDVRTIDWKPYHKNIWYGLRRYVLKESDNDIPKARRRFKRIIFGWRLLLIIWYSLNAAFIYFIISFIIYYFDLSIYFSIFPLSLIRRPTSMLELVWSINVIISLFVAYRLLKHFVWNS